MATVDCTVVAGWRHPDGALGEVADVYAVTCTCGNQASAYAMRDGAVTGPQRASASHRAWACFGEEARRGKCRACREAFAKWRRGTA